ncbi:MAG TPA: DUF4331 family protein [Polyangiaceae bacterium]|nr:DUF4331 family protein [Polyangiaceae bacterium]
MKRPLQMLGVVLALAGTPLTSLAADHGDAPAAANEPTADITDLYAWMSGDASKVNLVLAVDPNAGPGATFSPAVVYHFSISSSQGYGQLQTAAGITCKFIDTTNIECWLTGGASDPAIRTGNDYVVGDPSSADGLLSKGGGMRVFAGRRDDPFFLNYAGFQAAVKDAVAAAPMLQKDSEGCPTLDAATQKHLVVDDLQGDGTPGSQPKNAFAGSSVLALVIQLDKRLVTTNGPVLGVWASTHPAGN